MCNISQACAAYNELSSKGFMPMISCYFSQNPMGRHFSDAQKK